MNLRVKWSNGNKQIKLGSSETLSDTNVQYNHLMNEDLSWANDNSLQQ